MIKRRPQRLEITFSNEPVYFVTFCTRNRQKIPDLAKAQVALEAYAQRGINEFRAAIGRYVIMPDHLHLFVSGDREFVLSNCVSGLKRSISKAIGIRGEFWQPTFFDHILRNDESYSGKWEYVWQNPVRAGLVKEADEWPYQGEPVLIDRV
ncbi:MAG TPA: transposase [Chthoniobacterales bacterium]|jgi:REP element-mobilizing transposase RayT|nr:transposase [Chthoniobacterales bacterium]